MGRLPHPAAHRLYELAAARPAAPRHRVEPRRGAGPAAALRLSPQPPAQGVRQRRGRIGRDARSAEGPSHYFGYLLDLRRHHAGRPVLVAEYGVPSSRGVSHLQPEGMHHGGHDEEEMAAIDVRLTREIREAGLAGGIVFAWLEEWFKHTWVTIDLELPAERTRLWHNVMDAEQNYGLLGEYAGAAGGTPEPGGDPVRWRALPVLEHSDTVALRVGADPSYLYLVLDGGPALDSTRYVVGIETQRGSGGERTLPGVSEVSDVGFEI